MKYVIDWLDNEIKTMRSILSDKEWSSRRTSFYEGCRLDLYRKLKECVLARKILSEETVKGANVCGCADAFNIIDGYKWCKKHDCTWLDKQT